MYFELIALIQENLSYVVISVGIMTCVVWLIAVSFRIRKVRRLLVLQGQRVDEIESQSRVPAERAEQKPKTPPAMESAHRYKMLYLHSLGRSAEQIAEETGARPSEVNFIIKMEEHLRSLDEALVLR